VPKRNPQAVPQKVLILGATSAIAQATARLLAERGSSFYLVARDPEKLATVAADLQTRGAASVGTCAMDLDQVQAHPDLLARAVQSLGTVEMALLAYGVLGDQLAAQADPYVAEAVLRTNFLSPASLIALLANYFEGHGAGCLAVIGSVAGDRGRKSNYIYGASKAGLAALLDGVRNRVDRAGVHILTIKPGFVATPMTAHLPRGPLFAEPRTIGQGILRAIASRQDTVYLPGFWRPIMLVIRLIPARIFKTLNL
jgi:decaprenylphospho-beta-D-erythro-pentofuranosid-2-ulose 2-reductase